MLTKEQITELKEAYTSWSGGFEPESREKFEVFVIYARPGDMDENDVRRTLIDWIDEQSV